MSSSSSSSAHLSRYQLWDLIRAEVEQAIQDAIEPLEVRIQELEELTEELETKLQEQADAFEEKLTFCSPAVDSIWRDQGDHTKRIVVTQVTSRGHVHFSKLDSADRKIEATSDHFKSTLAFYSTYEAATVENGRSD